MSGQRRTHSVRHPGRLRSRRFVTIAAASLAALGLLASAPVSAASASGSQAPAHPTQPAQGRAGQTPPACPVPGSSTQPLYRDTQYSFAERAADLVSCMTLAEKVAQLRTNSAPAIPRLGVQQYTYWSEGQHGINTLGANTNPGSVGGGVHATSFPTNFASTMTWDPKLVYQETTAISDEIRGELDKSLWGVGQNNIGPDPSDYGSLTFWAPTVNLDRDPRWGRTDEAFGEDPYLVGRMAGAFVDGYQGETLGGQATGKYLKVASTAKHFALNEVENNRNGISSDTTDENIRNYYTAQFRSLVENSHVSGIMTSYNAINGTPAPANTYTANELLQRTWGFNGYTTSDCGAVGNVYGTPPGNHFWAPPGWTTSQQNGSVLWTNNQTGQTVPGAAGGQAYALRAGTQLNCTGAEETLPNIQAAIQAGVLDEGVVDNALVHLFTLRMRTGEFDPASQVPYTKITKAQIESTAHQALARKVADNSIVLLKNDHVAGTDQALLPVDPSTVHSVVIVGNLANQVTLGGYSGDPDHHTSAVQGITSELAAAAPDATVQYDSCGTSTTATAAASCSQATLDDIKTADLVVVFAGTDASTAGEGHDRSNIALPGNYSSLISQVNAVGNPRTVLALQTDGPVTIDNISDDFPAIVFSAYNGQAQGSALADVLFGAQDPAGHLDFTWYKDDSQLPAIDNYGLTPDQTGGLGRTYQYFTGTPTYPFGYGLSYTSFGYSDARIDHSRTTANGSVNVSFTVTNTGSSAGSTVAQLYAGYPTAAGVTLPNKRLVGFQKTAVLKPGQRQQITIPVKISDLAQYSDAVQREVVYPGTYQFQVATDASDTVATLPVNVSGQIATSVKYVTVQPGQVVYSPGDTIDLTGTNPWIGDDTGQADQHVKADGIVEAVNNDESFVDLSHARVQYSTSNPAVASVSRAGKVTILGAGAATIRVTVDGVTGTAPILVRQPFALTAPSVVTPGSTFTASATLTDPANAPTLTDAALALQAPSGWTVTPAGPTTFDQVGAGTDATAKWSVTVPSDTTDNSDSLTATATYTGSGGTSTATASAPVLLPYKTLGDAFDNVGISDDAHPNAGNLDGGGVSYSAEALAAGTPALTPGGTVNHDGVTIQWPNVAAGTDDNVVASGQAIDVGAAGTDLVIVGTGNNGTAGGTGTITYTDGSTQDFDLSLADWWSNAAAPGSEILTTVPYINNASGRENQQVSLYDTKVPLDPTKTVDYVTLPHVSDLPVSGQALHIFDLAVTRSVTVSAPSVVTPGTGFTVTGTLPNSNGEDAITDVAQTLTAPSGWTVQATTPTSVASPPAGQPVTVQWTVTPPADATAGSVPLAVQATFTDKAGNHTVTGTAPVSVPSASLAAAYNNVGVSDDASQSVGNYDGVGRSFSAEALAAATPALTPGATFTHDGLTFTWPSAAVGTPDNIDATGQTVPLSGTGKTLGIIGAANNGTASGTAVITYTDGSTQSFPLSFADWWAGVASGNDDILTSVPYLNSASGSVNQQVSLYYASVALQTGKTPAYLTLPNAQSGALKMHVFTVAIG